VFKKFKKDIWNGENMKGIIIAAGYGTRFLPATKTIPKEMFPLVDTPAIDFIVEEFVRSGIKDILIVSSRRKKSLEDYFDREMELESVFKKENDDKKLEKIRTAEANFFFIRQKEMLGTGNAILLCREFTGNDPFIVAYPDDLVFSEKPLSRQLSDIYDRTGGCVMAVTEEQGDVSRYGVIDYIGQNGLLKVKGIIEKPKKGTEPSKMISIGRYLFTPELMRSLAEKYESHRTGEFYPMDSINELASRDMVFACDYDGERIDVGDKIGYIEGIIKYSLSRPDLKEDVARLLKKYVQ
jgi:UTP--glucose-1-phosphate uridylyltransferase